MSLQIFSEKRGWKTEILEELGCYIQGDRVFIPTREGQYISRDFNGKNPIKSKGKQMPFIIKGSSDKIFVFEGETDSISFHHQYPEHNVFALLGTENYRILKKINDYFIYKKVIICFNNDEAGEKCTFNVTELFKKDKQFNQYDLRILGFPKNCKDIDDFYKQFGKNEILCNLKKVILGSIIQDIESEDVISFMKLKYDKDVIIGKFVNCVNPTHEDKHPSMMVYKDGIHCFSCGFHINLKKKQTDINGLRVDNFQFNIERYYEDNPFFYDKQNIFWKWNKKEYKYEIVDEVDLMIDIERFLQFNGQTINSFIKHNYIEAFKRVGRQNIPAPAPKKWIQFKDKAFSLKSSTMYDVTSKYFFTNPIPWEIGETSNTPIMDKLFNEWVGEKYVKTLYEIIAYCCYSDYPIHLIFCFVGCGRNGKSKYQGLIQKFIGSENICSTELDTLLESRFESFKLYKKLICSMGETNFGVLNKTSLLKRLTGQDLIGFEFKNKMPFDDYNYAKIVISSNSLPTSEDTSEGFYRRWCIIDFPNQFEEGADILESIPEQEYIALTKKVCEILPELLKNGSFVNQGSIEQRKERYINASNPLSIFLNAYCDKSPDIFMKYGELYIAYNKYLTKIKRRNITNKEFSKLLGFEGLQVENTTRYFELEQYKGRIVFEVKLSKVYIDEFTEKTISIEKIC
jgi:P4 family phage/plasmid primase-like protien